MLMKACPKRLYPTTANARFHSLSDTSQPLYENVSIVMVNDIKLVNEHYTAI